MLLLGPALPAAAQKADSASEQALRQSIETFCRGFYPLCDASGTYMFQE
jgi:hypothetical protein